MSNEPGRGIHGGLFLVALTTLHHEILLTRIFSVTLWYHYAFLALSLAMFGMTAGAIRVHLTANSGPPRPEDLARTTLAFALSILLSFLTHLSIPFAFHPSLAGIWAIALNLTIISIPFYFSGLVVTRILTGFDLHTGRLYAVDLCGAACGCLTVILALNTTDGPTGIILGSLFAALAACVFMLDATRTGERPGSDSTTSRVPDPRRVPDGNEGSPTGQGFLVSTEGIRQAAGSMLILLIALVAINQILTRKNTPLIPLLWIKGSRAGGHLYEKWNSFSRIRVYGDPDQVQSPFGWGFSPRYEYVKGVRRLHLDIDSAAGTPLSQFSGDTAELSYLRYDLTHMAHYLKSSADVLAVGVGGGRDILAALAFNQRSVTGVEMNEAILDCLNRVYGDFTGHLDKIPSVSFVNEDARSFVTRQKEIYDLVQVSMVDTWAATAAGAYVLAENSLYTIEGWRAFLGSLRSDGILSVSRWYSRTEPAEIYRLTALASQVLLDSGVEDPSAHIMIARVLKDGDPLTEPEGLGTLILSRSPFRPDQIDRIEKVCQTLGFELVQSPWSSLDPVIDRIARARDLETFFREHALVLDPPTDDRPFFFNMLRLSSFLDPKSTARTQFPANYEAVLLLGTLFAIVLVMASLSIIIPLRMTRHRQSFRTVAPDVVYFAGIGLGFMLIEVSQMQRLVVFLGHPTRALSVVLFTLLLGGGIGSWFVGSRRDGGLHSGGILLVLLADLAAFGLVTPWMTSHVAGATLGIRLTLAVSGLAVLGMGMGTAFPLGFTRSLRRNAGSTALLWGVNGAASIVSSVLAVLLAVSVGISAAYWLGFLFYVMACIAYRSMSLT